MTRKMALSGHAPTAGVCLLILLSSSSLLHLGLCQGAMPVLVWPVSTGGPPARDEGTGGLELGKTDATTTAVDSSSHGNESAVEVKVEECGLGQAFSCQNRCGVFRGAPCSCHAECLMDGTCCEDFRSHCPQIEEQLSPAQRSFVGAPIKCSVKLPWPVVSGCLPPANASAVDHRTKQRCERERPVFSSDVIPVTDPSTRVHFKNVHCAKCNGLDVRSLVPWSGDFRCSLDIKTVAELFEESINGTVSGIWCPILWQSPGRDASPSKGSWHATCVPESELTTPSQCRNETMLGLCKSGALGYLSVDVAGETKVYRNRYCLMCHAEQTGEQIRSCDPLETVPSYQRDDYFYFMHIREKNGTWTFAGGNATSRPTFAMAIAEAQCDSKQDDLSPENCNVSACHPSYYLENNRCLMRSPYFYTMFFVLQTAELDFANKSAFAADVLTELEKPFNEIIIGENSTLTEVKSAEFYVDQNNEITFSFRLFVRATSYRKTMSIYMKYKDAALAIFESNKLTVAYYCDKVLPHHVTYDYNCTDFDVYQLTATANNDRSDNEDSIGHDPQADTSGGKTAAWTWRNYLSISCLSISILSLSVRICLQPVLTFFHSYACKLQFFLCLSLLLGYAFFVYGGIPPPGSVACVVAAVTTHWAMLSALLWMNVNAIQIWKIFRPGSWSQVSSQQAVDYRWHLYAWLGPAILVGPELVLDRFVPDSPYSPLYGRAQCWFNSGQALLFFFVVPSLFISTVNFLFIVLITYALHTQKMQYGDSAPSIILEVRACSKLVVLVGVTWLLGIPVVATDEPIFGDIFTLANATLGFFIVMAIMGNKFFCRNVKEQYSKRDNGSRKTKTFRVISKSASITT